MIRRCQVSIVRSTRAGQPMVSEDRRRPGQLRRMNGALLTLWDLRPCIDVAALVLTELVTNAFQHGGGEGITVTWCADVTHLTMRVEDSSLPCVLCSGLWTRPRRAVADWASWRRWPTRGESARTAVPFTARSPSRSMRRERDLRNAAGR